ncbi:MAG: cold-shock protein [Planctomycetota bacterium]|jgi:CspA family cold shock protein
MAEGKVKWFNGRRGYGFITTADGTEVFVHFSNIEGDGFRTLSDGDTVSFDLVDGEKGQRAENVVPLAEAVAKKHPESDEGNESK